MGLRSEGPKKYLEEGLLRYRRDSKGLLPDSAGFALFVLTFGGSGRFVFLLGLRVFWHQVVGSRAWAEGLGSRAKGAVLRVSGSMF